MIDLFGLNKRKDPQAPAVDAAPPPAAARGSHKLWAFLLVLDAVFVIVFAGAVAAKVYQYWNATVNPVIATPRRRPVKELAKTVETPAAAPVEAPAVTVAPLPKAPEPAAPATVKASADAPRPPKPSLLTDAPKHREMPAPANAASAPTAPSSAPSAAPSADGKAKALRVEFKIRAPKARSVYLVGAFIVRGGRKEMTLQDDGTWTVTLYLNPGQYRYFFSVDKKKNLDPENPNSEKGASLLSVP